MLQKTVDSRESPENHIKKTAGSVMETRVPVVNQNLTISDVEKLIIEKIDNFETINYIYIVDDKKELKGVLSVKDLFRSNKNDKIINFTKKAPISVGEKIDQEQVALLSIRENIKAVPVVNGKNEFIGAVPSDEILNILHSEQLEDLLLFSGLTPSKNPVKDFIKISTLAHFNMRFPWLMIGLIGGVFAALVVGFFEGVFAEEVALVAFIPAVVYMADAVGAQTQMIFIKTLALENSLKIKSYIKREIAVNSLLAISLGLVIYTISFLWLRSPEISLILAMSIFLSVIFSMLVAIFLPWILQKYNKDSAIASGPPATVVRDISSLVIYFVVAALIL